MLQVSGVNDKGLDMYVNEHASRQAVLTHVLGLISQNAYQQNKESLK